MTWLFVLQCETAMPVKKITVPAVIVDIFSAGAYSQEYKDLHAALQRESDDWGECISSIVTVVVE